ncbi:3-keto-steroid reductase [Pichia californica]|uniref:3beta-hydroxysteroid 3-dehydrogenase n=1 Tax=Pichia californica TaxID=460514 RepID=A0A9P6WLH4_9ASCO|nr:3-keto-steroid reductase [[Candida] californica]KAG0687908.1 3-keto-steroid reductase [[Candida] californica]
MPLQDINHLTALITGTSGNLGINIAKRLIKEVPHDKKLTIIVTSRTLANANQTIQQLNSYNLEEVKRSAILDFDYSLMDFTDMVSILAAVYELQKNHKCIDLLYLNAAQGVYKGIDWWGATVECCTNPIKGVTYPTYKIQEVGVKSKDDLGLVFQANVFGPYYFIHKLIQYNMFGNSKDPRIIWISSVMSKPSYLSMDDLELLKSNESYEGSKRLIDLIHLATYKQLSQKYHIKQYLTHPGIVTSFSFFKFLNPITYYGMLFLFYLARLLGSPWHNIHGWIAANAPIYVSLYADQEFDKQNVKYGSASRWNGKEYLKTDEVDSTGENDVLTFFQSLTKQWDEKLKNQIVNTRTL